MARRFLSHVFLAAALAAAFVSHPRVSRADDTTHVREFAKNKPRVLIVASGPQAAEVGRVVQDAILRHPQNRHKPQEVAVLGMEEAAASRAEFARVTTIFLLIGAEMNVPLSPALAPAVPLKPAVLGGRDSVVRSVLARGKAGEAAYQVGLYAPDRECLGRLSEAFLSRGSENFRKLPFEDTYVTNRVAVFSAPEDRAEFERWGERTERTVWNDVQWYPLSAQGTLSPEQTRERSRVFFLVRSSRRDPAPPPAAAALLAGQALKPNTVLVRRGGDTPADGAATVVFSAPSRLLLQRKAARYPSVDRVPADTVREEALDVRAMRRTAILVGGATREDKEPVLGLLREELRRHLGVGVEDVAVRAPGDVSLADLQEGGDVAERLRGRRVRYAWLFSLDEYGGTTRFRTQEEKMTPDLDPFTETEPKEPSLKKRERDPDGYRRDYNEWRRKRAKWEDRRDDWNDEYDNGACVWERQVERSSRATLRGTLRLVDLQHGGRVLWEAPCEQESTDRGLHHSDRVTVRGHRNSPYALTAPEPLETCAPDLLKRTARAAGVKALVAAQEALWLPEAGAPDVAAPDASASGGGDR